MPPPTTQCDPVTVQDRVLNAAEQVVARDGVVNLTLEAVAREAGVSKGGLLYHFPTKSSLITAIVERCACQCEAEQQKALDQDSTSPGAFTRAYIAARMEPIDPKEVPIHSALLAAAGTDPQYLDPFRRRAIQWQEKFDHDGIDPITGTIVRLAMNALCLGDLLGMPVPQGEDRKQVIERLIAMTREKRDVKE